MIFVHGISSFTMQSIRKNSFQKLTHITSIYPPTDISVDGCVNFEFFLRMEWLDDYIRPFLENTGRFTGDILHTDKKTWHLKWYHDKTEAQPKPYCQHTGQAVPDTELQNRRYMWIHPLEVENRIFSEFNSETDWTIVSMTI